MKNVLHAKQTYLKSKRKGDLSLLCKSGLHTSFGVQPIYKHHYYFVPSRYKMVYNLKI